MNEFELIQRLTKNLPGNETVIAGAGDDCAVLDLGSADQWLLFKTDAVVEGIHFDSHALPRQVGHKALGRCLSDIAAMAGVPRCALITLGLPKDFSLDFVDGLYEGIRTLATRFNVAIVGGETTGTLEGVFIAVSMIGTVAKDRCILRSGARPGDAIFVTGELGGSIHGKHLTFEPRLDQAQWLANHFLPRAMIDLSDGLAGDLRHVLSVSHVGAELLASAIPISAAARAAAGTGHARGSPLAAALSDGEDFELLFTLEAKQAVPLLDAWKPAFPELPLSCVGRITESLGISLRTPDGIRPLTEHGYVHFT